MEFDGNVHGSRGLEDGKRGGPFEGEWSIGGVLDDDNVIGLCPCNDINVELRVCRGAGRVIGIV